jgi:hypothetical protein
VRGNYINKTQRDERNKRLKKIKLHCFVENFKFAFFVLIRCDKIVWYGVAARENFG